MRSGAGSSGDFDSGDFDRVGRRFTGISPIKRIRSRLRALYRYRLGLTWATVALRRAWQNYSEWLAIRRAVAPPDSRVQHRT